MQEYIISILKAECYHSWLYCYVRDLEKKNPDCSDWYLLRMDSSVEAHPETMISELDDGSRAQYRNTVDIGSR